jgi:hypothetical protein
MSRREGATVRSRKAIRARPCPLRTARVNSRIVIRLLSRRRPDVLHLSRMPRNRIRTRPPICIGSEPRLLGIPDGETLDVAAKFGAIEKSGAGMPAKLPPIHLSLSCGCYCVIDIALSSLSNQRQRFAVSGSKGFEMRRTFTPNPADEVSEFAAMAFQPFDPRALRIRAQVPIPIVRKISVTLTGAV